MRIWLRVAPDRARRWMADLAAACLAVGASVRLVETAGRPAPRLLALALELDRLIVRRGRPSGADPIAAAEIAPPPDAEHRPDLVLDLTEGDAAAPLPAGARLWRLAFDGHPGEDALVAALAAGRAPLVTVVDGDGAVLERARPSLERAHGLGEALATVGARTTHLLAVRLAAEIAGRPRPVAPDLELDAPAERSPLRAVAATLAHDLARTVARLVFATPHWRVGWRRVDGPGLVDGAGFATPFRPLPDAGTRFHADPFPVIWQGETVVFVEDFDHATDRGRISVVPFGPDGPTGPARPIVEEPWHLSYPFPVVVDGVLHLMPESTARRDLGLYRCIAFPDRWERVATLVDDAVVSDASLVEWAGRWWMFATDEDGLGGWSDMLTIRSAPSVYGPWRRHALDPVLIDAAAARPAGCPWVAGGRLFRPVQDCLAGYGRAVTVAEVTRLDDDGFTQVPRRRIAPGPHWPGGRLHTVNRAGTLEVIDGAVLRPRLRALDPLIEPWFRPRGGAR